MFDVYSLIFLFCLFFNLFRFSSHFRLVRINRHKDQEIITCKDACTKRFRYSFKRCTAAPNQKSMSYVIKICTLNATICTCCWQLQAAYSSGNWAYVLRDREDRGEFMCLKSFHTSQHVKFFYCFIFYELLKVKYMLRCMH